MIMSSIIASIIFLFTTHLLLWNYNDLIMSIDSFSIADK